MMYFSYLLGNRQSSVTSPGFNSFLFEKWISKFCQSFSVPSSALARASSAPGMSVSFPSVLSLVPPSNGVFADPDNCQCYWDCANLDPFHMCCGQDTLFSARLLVCDFAFAVDCGDRPLPGSTRPPTPTTPSTDSSVLMSIEFSIAKIIWMP